MRSVKTALKVVLKEQSVPETVLRTVLVEVEGILKPPHFWSRFISHYLPSLQERQKWQKDGKHLEPDQVVLIVDPQLPRALWPVGKVTATYPGADGRIRTVAIKVKDRTYVQPVARRIQLPKLEDAADDPPI